MNRRWIAGILAASLLFSACNRPAENPENVTSVPAPESDANAILSQIDLGDYESFETELIVPQLEQLADYLRNAAAFHTADITGEVQLWSAVLPVPIPYTQLLAYPVLMDGEEFYLGVDRCTGLLYRWKPNDYTSRPENLAAPEIFSTPLSALEYAKTYHWDPRGITQPDEMLLITPVDGMPFYCTAPVNGDDIPSGASFIDITDMDEQSYTLHLYTYIKDSDEYGHTATFAWLRVYKNGFVVDEIIPNRWIAESATE